MSTASPPARPTADLRTVAAVAIVAYVSAILFHEGLGHGGACVLGHGQPRRLVSIFFDCDETGMSEGWIRFVSANGSLTNLAVGLPALALLHWGRARLPPVLRYGLWLFALINLLQGPGYFMFSGLTGVGDWARVFPGGWPARALMTVVGAAIYFLAVPRLLMPHLEPFLGAELEERKVRRFRLLLFPYLVGSTAYVLSGLLNPEGWQLVIISAAAGGFGGTSLLAWYGGPLTRPRPATPPYALPLGPRPVLWGAAGVLLLAFIALGHGITFNG